MNCHCGEKVSAKGLCKKHYGQQYYPQYQARNREKLAAATRRWRKNHPDRVKKANDSEKARAARATYAASPRGKAKILESERRRNAANPQAHRDRGRRNCARRRDRAMYLKSCNDNAEMIELIYAEAVHRRLHVDHIIPLNGKFVSGLNVFNNLQLMTRQQNKSKTNKFDTTNPSRYALIPLGEMTWQSQPSSLSSL